MKYYIAQDLSGAYFVYTKKPHKGMAAWIGSGGNIYPVSLDFIESLHRIVKISIPKWTDEEPIELSINIKYEKV